jgi:hypothetical protein
MVSRASRHAICVVFLFGPLGCGSDKDASPDGGTGGATGTGGSAGTGGTPAAGGTQAAGGGSNAGGDPSICHASNLSSAPLQCLQDWSHATARYKSQCSTTGGYQGFCDPYDTIIYQSGSSNVWCYHDTGTGNLIGARSTENSDGTGGTCTSFDTSFSEPAIASCAPVSGGACTAP